MTLDVVRIAAQHAKIRIDGVITARAARCTRRSAPTVIKKPRFPFNQVETGLFIAAIASAQCQTAIKLLQLKTLTKSPKTNGLRRFYYKKYAANDISFINIFYFLSSVFSFTNAAFNKSPKLLPIELWSLYWAINFWLTLLAPFELL